MTSAELPDDIAKLKEMVLQEHQRAELFKFRWEKMARRYFGPSSEKSQEPSGQQLLFVLPQAEAKPAESLAGTAETSLPAKPHGGGRKKLPPELGLFNTVMSGGALIWELYPEWHVFIDGRANLYGRAFMNQYRAALANPLEWEKWVRARGVGVAYIQYGPEDDTVLLQYLVLALRGR